MGNRTRQYTGFPVRPTLARESQRGVMLSNDQPPRLKLNVLVIDDMPPVLMLLERMLSKQGQTVWPAASGEESLEIFRNHKIDLVICDLVMPGMNGWRVGKIMRTICREKGVNKTPFILLTGWGGQALETAKIAESGVDVVLGKPLVNEQLMKAVRKVIELSPEADLQGREVNP